MNDLLHVAGLTVQVRSTSTTLVKDVELTLAPGETVAIVGESGSGKSMTARALMGLLPNTTQRTAGEIWLDGMELTNSLTGRSAGKPRGHHSASESDGWASIRGTQMGMIFQDALAALNPCLTVGFQLSEMFRVHRGASRSDSMVAAGDLMRQMGIPDPQRRLSNYPHQFSGGMRQRVMIAVALALEPSVVIADEPTTALDVTVQAQILGLLQQRQQEAGMGLILISHDLGVVARTADRIAVMYSGRIVETGSVADVYSQPAHPYTRALMAAAPSGLSRGHRLAAIEGQPPDPEHRPTGCHFRTRCPLRFDDCVTHSPELRSTGERHMVACHLDLTS